MVINNGVLNSEKIRLNLVNKIKKFFCSSYGLLVLGCYEWCAVLDGKTIPSLLHAHIVWANYFQFLLRKKKGIIYVIYVCLQFLANDKQSSNVTINLPVPQAIQRFDMEEVHELVMQDRQVVRTAVCGGLTPLHAACHLRNLNIVRLLLDHGAEVGTLITGYLCNRTPFTYNNYFMFALHNYYVIEPASFISCLS